MSFWDFYITVIFILPKEPLKKIVHYIFKDKIANNAQCNKYDTIKNQLF